jgi:hypothetical protein
MIRWQKSRDKGDGTIGLLQRLSRSSYRCISTDTHQILAIFLASPFNKSEGNVSFYANTLTPDMEAFILLGFLGIAEYANRVGNAKYGPKFGIQ